MSDIKNKVNSKISGEDGKCSIVSACVIAVLAVALFFTAMFAPFQYCSDMNTLHIVHLEEQDPDKPDEPRAVIYEIERVHQSLFRLFEAATYLSDASVLHDVVAGAGQPTDRELYEKARARLDELRGEFNDIHLKTVNDAGLLGIETDSIKFTEMLADNLSDMNLIALDMLETAYRSDNTGVYEAVYGGIVLGLFNALINLAIMAAAVVAIIFAMLALFGKVRNRELLFLQILSALPALGMILCLFNPLIPPAAGPLALCCISFIVFSIYGFINALGKGNTTSLIKNTVVGVIVPTAFLLMSIVPSFTVYVNGMGGNYLYYPGTVGTVICSVIRAQTETGLNIPHSPVTIAIIIGSIAAVMLAVVSVKALERLYKNAGSDGDALFGGVLAVTGAAAMAMVISVAAITGNIQDEGSLVKYISGASWYIALVSTILCTVFFALYNTFARRISPGSIAVAEDKNGGEAAEDGTSDKTEEDTCDKAAEGDINEPETISDQDEIK